MMNKLFTIATALALLSGAAHAGNEAKGTEDYVLIGLLIKAKMTPEQLVIHEKRVKEIEEFVTNPQTLEYLAAFYEQAEPEKFTQKTHDLFLKLKSAGAAAALRKSKVYTSDKCGPKQNLTASTLEIPGEDICINPARMAILELGVLEHARTFKSDHFSIILGVLLHENARQFKEDASHEYLLSTTQLVHRKLIILNESNPEVQIGARFWSRFGPVDPYFVYYTTVSNNVQMLKVDFDKMSSLSFLVRPTNETSQSCLRQVTLSWNNELPGMSESFVPTEQGLAATVKRERIAYLAVAKLRGSIRFHVKKEECEEALYSVSIYDSQNALVLETKAAGTLDVDIQPLVPTRAGKELRHKTLGFSSFKGGVEAGNFSAVRPLLNAKFVKDSLSLQAGVWFDGVYGTGLFDPTALLKPGWKFGPLVGYKWQNNYVLGDPPTGWEKSKSTGGLVWGARLGEIGGGEFTLLHMYSDITTRYFERKVDDKNIYTSSRKKGHSITLGVTLNFSEPLPSR